MSHSSSCVFPSGHKGRTGDDDPPTGGGREAVGGKGGAEGWRVALGLYLHFASLFWGVVREGLLHFDNKAPHGFAEGAARRPCIEKTAAAINHPGHIQLDNITDCKQTNRCWRCGATKSGSATSLCGVRRGKAHFRRGGKKEMGRMRDCISPIS